jgi:peroxiredoxin
MLVGVAYVLGTQAGGLLDEWRMSHNAEQYRSKAIQQTAAILRKMGTIKVGDTLSNFAFEDIDGELHLLNEILTDKTLITYMKPDCDGCLVELERLRSAADSPEDYERVLIISSANPLHLHKLREDYGLGCLMLYDEERLFGSALEIYTYPFNLVVNRDRVILEIHGSVLLPDDYERLFSVWPGAWQTPSHPEPVEGWLTRVT